MDKTLTFRKIGDMRERGRSRMKLVEKKQTRERERERGEEGGGIGTLQNI
ncbi:unnamed protein product [Brassica oleracea var. botrytis]